MMMMMMVVVVMMMIIIIISIIMKVKADVCTYFTLAAELEDLITCKNILGILVVSYS